MYDYLLAVALLNSLPELPSPPIAPERCSALRAVMQSLAIQWEILDHRELHYILARNEDFAADLTLLRRRYRELANAPALSDAERFPDRAMAGDLLSFNRAYRQHVGARQAVDPSRSFELQEAIQETDRLYQVWDTVRDARCDYYYISARRLALKQLRELLGDEAYYAGQMPPHVPLWRFQRID